MRYISTRFGIKLDAFTSQYGIQMLYLYLLHWTDSAYQTKVWFVSQQHWGVVLRGISELLLNGAMYVLSPVCCAAFSDNFVKKKLRLIPFYE